MGSAAAVVYGVFAIYQMGYGLGHGDMERVAKYHMDLYFESAGMILTLVTLPGTLVYRQGFAGERALVHGGLALHNYPVHRDGLPTRCPVFSSL